MDMWDAGEENKHKCYWCGEWTNSMFWSCLRCYELKEEGYKRARELNAKTREEVLCHVWDVMEKHGVKPVMPIA